MKKTAFSNKNKNNSITGPKNPREKYEAPRYKGIQDKRRDIAHLKRKIEDKNAQMTFKPKLINRNNVAKSMNFYQG